MIPTKPSRPISFPTFRIPTPERPHPQNSLYDIFSLKVACFVTEYTY